MPQARQLVLVFTHSEDEYVPDIVMRALERRGAEAVRVDTDRFPREHTLAVYDDDRGTLDLGEGQDEIDLVRVRAAWLRRLWFAQAPLDVDPHYELHAKRQAHDAALGLIDWLDARGVRVLNNNAAQLRAERKVLQLHAARAASLPSPPSVITNDPSAVRAFVAEHGPTVTKLLVPLSQTMDGSGTFMHTSDVDAADLEAIDSVRLAPMIFQARVNKVREVRVIVVGDAIFAAATAVTSLDWRVGDTAWSAVRVPRAIERGVRALMRSLALSMGALDFVVDADEQWWFLEINPAGEWGWLERDLKLPIADAIAKELLSS